MCSCIVVAFLVYFTITCPENVNPKKNLPGDTVSF